MLTFPEGQHVIFDTATEFRLQMIREGVRNIEHVIYTHTHSDHCHGFDDLRAFFFQSDVPIFIHAARQHLDDLQTRFSYAFQNTAYHGTKPKVILHEIIPGLAFNIFGVDVEMASAHHGDATTSVFKVGPFVYATDFKSLPEELLERWKGQVHTIVASGLKMESHPTHSSIPETVAIIEKIKAKQGVITHLGHEIDYHAISESLPTNIQLAFDGLSVVCPLVL